MNIVEHRGYQLTQGTYSHKVEVFSDSGNKVLSEYFSHDLSDLEARNLINALIEFQARITRMVMA